jgi:selenocysteine-specific elongation factor
MTIREAEHRRFVVGTAGHIDHGKTELVRALTGTNTDRLPEEQARGITIDLGFAFLEPAPDLRLAFIDVPGHERFVKNMLAGVGGIDLVLLVVAADESVMPQTREHLEICSLLGVRRGLVALTKIDLVPEDLRELAELEVRELLAATPLDGAPVVLVSGKTGEGVPALRDALVRAVADLEPRDPFGPVRLPVDRSFSIRGFGTVVTGTLFSGTVRAGDELMIYPGEVPVRVRRVEVHDREAEVVQAGERTALNLQGVEVAAVRRGSVVATRGALMPSGLVDVRLQLLASAPAPLKDLARVRYHLGTAEVLARVKLLGRRELRPGEESLAQLRLERPHVAVPGERFIIRRYSPARTIGGGAVLDPTPRKHRGAAAEALEALEHLAAAPPGERLPLLILESGLRGVRTAELQVRTGLTAGQLERPLQESCARDALRRIGEGERAIHVATPALEDAAGAIRERLASYHAAHPLEPGLRKEELRERVAGDAPPEVFRHLLEWMAAQGAVAVEGEWVRSGTHRLRLSDEEERARSAIEEAFRGAGLNPPAPDAVLREAGLSPAKSQALYQLLLRSGQLVRIRDGLTFHAEALEELRSRLLNFRRERDTIDVAAFKELSGTTRKNAIPLLEYLDAQRITRRQGNERLILAPAHLPDPGEPSA